MNEEIILLSDLDLPYKSSETKLKSVDELQRSLKRNALSVLEVYSELPKLQSVDDLFENCYRDNNSDSCDMDQSDLSDNTCSSTVSSIDCNVICLEAYEELKIKCKLLGLRFVDCSEDKQANWSSLNSVTNKNLTINCLLSYEDLVKESERLGLRFNDCSPSDKQANWSSLNSVTNKTNLTINCLLSYEDLVKESERLGLRFNDCSPSDKQANWSSLNSVTNKTNLTINCLLSYEDLVKESERLGLRFNDCSPSDKQANWSSLNSVTNKTNFTINCLLSYEDLVKESETLGLKFHDCSLTDNKVYEVDLIIKDKVEEGQKYYLVKWKYYDMKTNTWEPDYNLTGCNDMINYYETLQKPENRFNKDTLFYFIKELITRKPYDILTLIRTVSFVTGTSESSVKKMSRTLTELKLKAKGILDLPFRKLLCHKNELLRIMRFAEERKVVLINLKEWEYDINSFNPATYIEVENNADLEKAPADFQFIHDYVTEGIKISEEPAIFCECNDCLKSKNLCCPRDSDAHFAYNKFRRLQLLPGYPIYECNKLCKCDKDCVNRVVQHGPKVKVAIFRTSNGCGWGLKALEVIQKDQFVLEYLGEILTSDAAEIRGREYDNVGRSYLFDLDYGEENCQYTVDAGHVGNASHFINHSCEPNLHVFAVWINNQDPQLPRLAFFAKKKINRGEELTFDYKMVKTRGEDGFGSSPGFEGKVLCKCNARKCRKYLC